MSGVCIGIHTIKYHLVIKITTQHISDNQTGYNFTSMRWIIEHQPLRKKTKIAKKEFKKKQHRSTQRNTMNLTKEYC